MLQWGSVGLSLFMASALHGPEMGFLDKLNPELYITQELHLTKPACQKVKPYSDPNNFLHCIQLREKVF